MACLAGAPPAAAQTVTFKATADAHTDASAPTVNYGTNSSMKVDAQALKVSYVRFQPTVSGPITKATLRVYTNTASTTGLDVRSLGTAVWDELTINHNNRPWAPTPVLASSGPFDRSVWISLDVTAAVVANQVITLELTTPSTAEALLATREAGTLRAPQLVIEQASTTTPPPPPPPPPAPAVFEQRPYSSVSPWNTPIGAFPTVHPNSAAGVALIGGPITSDPTQYTYPLYVVDSSTPLANVRLSGLYSDVTGTATADTTLTRTTGATVTVPLRSEFSPADGSDAQIIIVNPATGDEWGFWSLSKDASGAWSATNGYHYNIYWDGHPPRDAGDRPFGSRGAGVTYFAGLVRPWEIRSGRIDHALAFAFGGNSWPSVNRVYPAAKSDGSSTDPNSLPEGARLQLDPSMTETELRNRGCSTAAVTIARAMQEYGMYVIDQSGSDKIMLEYTGTADWAALGVGRSTPSCIPLDRLRRVDITAP